MWSLFILCIVPLAGVRGDTDICEAPRPQCYYEIPFDKEAHKEYLENDDAVPSNEFFQKSCGTMIETAKCIRDHEKVCPTPIEDVSMDILVDNVVEFCDEESTIRKDYVAHIDCVNNRVNFTNVCIDTAEAIRSVGRKELDDLIEQKGVRKQCLLIRFASSCIVPRIEEYCGEETGRVANAISERIMDIANCRSEDLEFFVRLVGI